MAFEQKDNSGALFKNDRKTQDNHPHATGTVMIGGVEYWINAWTKTDKNGNKFQSLSFSPKDKRVQQSKPAPKAASSGFNDMPDDLPF